MVPYQFKLKKNMLLLIWLMWISLSLLSLYFISLTVVMKLCLIGWCIPRGYWIWR